MAIRADILAGELELILRVFLLSIKVLSWIWFGFAFLNVRGVNFACIFGQTRIIMHMISPKLENLFHFNNFRRIRLNESLRSFRAFENAAKR